MPLEVHVFTPAGMSGDTLVVEMPYTRFYAINFYAERTISVTLDTPPSSNAMITDYSLTFGVSASENNDNNIATRVVNSPDTSLGVINLDLVIDTYTYRLHVRDILLTLAGSLLTLTFEAIGRTIIAGDSTVYILENRGRLVSGTVTISDTQSFEQTITVLEFSGCDAASLDIYGFRPRPSPLVASERSTTVPDDTYVVATDTTALIAAELSRYANPIPVIAIDRASEDAAYLADILARRVGHKVHLTLNGDSQLGDDADFFVEAQEVRIAFNGELRSTLWCVQAPPPPPPPPPPAQPAGFQIFRLDNMSLLLFWDNPNDAEITGYRIWRGTSSGTINTEIENSVGSASTTQYTDDGLADGQEYWYQIQALYGMIASVRSDSASGIP